jgi:hypothetical protein
VLELRAPGMGGTAIAKAPEISCASLYRLLEEVGQ